MDTFEWSSGFEPKMGLFYVDFGRDERPRYPRASANFYNMMIKERGFTSAVRDLHACELLLICCCCCCGGGGGGVCVYVCVCVCVCVWRGRGGGK